MSLSDNDTDQFQQFDVTQVETIDSETANRDDQAKPDFERFKMLFEKPAFDEEGPGVFEALAFGGKKEEDSTFKPMIQSPDASSETPEDEPSSEDSTSVHEPEEPKETSDEKGYREGFENGYAEGLTQGQELGFKEGWEKGEEEGRQEGEKQGFEKGEELGRQEGLKTGEEQAEKETREKAVEIIGSLEEALKTSENTLPLLVEKYEGRIISLIRQISEKAVLATLEIDEEVVKSMILDAMKTLVTPEQVVLSVSEIDYDYIEMVKDDFFKEIDTLEQVTVRSDPGIERGGCKIETSTAAIETDPIQRLDAIFEAIKNHTRE